jgi:cyanate permease
MIPEIKVVEVEYNNLINDTKKVIPFTKNARFNIISLTTILLISFGVILIGIYLLDKCDNYLGVQVIGYGLFCIIIALHLALITLIGTRKINKVSKVMYSIGYVFCCIALICQSLICNCDNDWLGLIPSIIASQGLLILFAIIVYPLSFLIEKYWEFKTKL